MTSTVEEKRDCGGLGSRPRAWRRDDGLDAGGGVRLAWRRRLAGGGWHGGGGGGGWRGGYWRGGGWGWGGGWGAPVAAGVLGGLAVGAIAASAYPYGPYGGYGGCYLQNQPIYNGWGQFVGYRPVRVCY